MSHQTWPQTREQTATSVDGEARRKVNSIIVITAQLAAAVYNFTAYNCFGFCLYSRALAFRRTAAQWQCHWSLGCAKSYFHVI